MTEQKKTLTLFDRVSVVLPSLDPDEKLTAVIDGLLGVGFRDIILVNDGSKEENLHYFTDAAKLHPEITLLHHEYNRGKGAALKTAFKHFLENRPDHAGVVTVDGDNQHHPEDTLACAKQMLESGNTVLGVRDFNRPDVPKRSRRGNHITSAVFKFFCGMKISDTQTGLRAIPRDALEILVTVKGNRFEYETNMLLSMKGNGLSFEEVPIRTVYIEENKSSHFRVVRDSVRIYRLILGHFFKYTVSSIICSVVELVVYPAFTWLLNLISFPGSLLTTTTVFLSRIVSSLLNFFLNKKLVFGKKGQNAKTLRRYYTLAAIQLLVEIGLENGIVYLFGISETQLVERTVMHTLVMLFLFIFSYFIQQNWVFGDDTKKKKKKQ